MTTRMEAIEAGYIVNLRKAPIIVDITKRLYQAVEVNTAPETLKEVLTQIENNVKDSAMERKLTVEQMPYVIDDLMVRWKNWPTVKTGPVCGYIEYSALFTMETTTPTMLLALPDERRQLVPNL